MSGADWESALLTALLDDAALDALIDGRIDWDQRLQGDSLPVVVLVLISDPRPRHMGGEIGFRESRVQADCYAADGDAARAVREALIAAMEVIAHTAVAGKRFGLISVDGTGGGVDRGNAETQFRQRIDFLIWHD